MIKGKILKIILLSHIPLFSMCQSSNKFGAGLSYDNISGGGSMVFLYKAFKQHLEITAQFSHLKYGNFGYSFSADYCLYNRSRVIIPMTGLRFARNFGGRASFDESDLNGGPVIFNVGPTSYIIPTVGIQYDFWGGVNNKGEKVKSPISLYCKSGYKFNIAENVSVNLISGLDPNNKRSKIIRYHKNKPVFEIGAVFCW